MTVLIESDLIAVPMAAPDSISSVNSFSGTGLKSGAVRSIHAHTSGQFSTVLSRTSHPPHWIPAVINEVRRRDRGAVLNIDALSRVLRALSQLPEVSPKPEVGVGDDGTVGLEWDFQRAHLEIFVSNDPEYDAFLLDADDEDDVIEAPLFKTLPKVAKYFGRLAASE